VTYKLANSDEKFEAMCKGDDSKTREWIMAAIRRRRDMYMTTGLKCVRNANVELVQERKMAAGMKLSAPTAELFGVQDPQGDLDIGVAYERKNRVEKASALLRQENIYTRFSIAK
jgi:hypothetical protein